MPGIKLRDDPKGLAGHIVSDCCNAVLSISRVVGDTLTYYPERFTPGNLSWKSPPLLVVRYSKVYEGEGGDYVISCSNCLAQIEGVEVEES